MQISGKPFVRLIVFLCFFIPTVLTFAYQTGDEALPTCVSTLLPDATPTTLADAVTALTELRQTRRNAGEKRAEADALYCMGLTYYAQGDYPAFEQPFRDSRTQFERALLLYREVADRAGEARTLHQWGRTYFILRDYGNTLPNYQQALRTAQGINDIGIQADIRFDLGVFYSQQGNPSRDLEEAAFEYGEAYAGYLQTQNLARQAETLMVLGQTAFALQELEDAASNYESAADLYNELGETALEAQALHGAALILHHTGSLHEAEDAYNEVLTLYQEVGDMRGEGRVTAALGNIFHLYHYTIAEETLDRALRLARDSGDNVGRSIALSYMGDVLLSQGETDDALSNFETAIELATTANDIDAGALAYLGRGQVYAELARQGREPLQPALNDFGEAVRRYRDLLGDLYSLRRVFISEAWARYNVNPSDGVAYNLFFEARNKAQEIGDQRGEAESLSIIGQVYLRNRDYPQAANFFTEAAEMAELVGDPVLIGDINAYLGDIEILRADILAAQERYETALFNYEDGEEEVKAALMNSRLGTIDTRTGNYRPAIRYFESTIETLDGYDNPRRNQALVDSTLATANLGLGFVYVEMGLYDQATPQLSVALNLLVAVDDDFNAAAAQVYLGDVDFAQEDYNGASDLYRRAARSAEQVGNFRAQALALSGIGASMVALESDEALEIQENFEQALALARRILDQDAERRILMTMAESELRQGNRDAAVNLFSAARRVSLAVSDRRNAAFATLRLAYTYSLDPTDRLAVGATRTYTEAAEAYRAVPSPAGEALALQGLGDLALRRSQYSSAIDYFTQMQIAFDNANDPIGVTIALTRLGQTYQGQQRNELAVLSFDNAFNTLQQFKTSGVDELTDQRRLSIAEGEFLRARGDYYRVMADIAKANQDLELAVSTLEDTRLLAQDQLSIAVYTLGILRLEQNDITAARQQFERARDIAQRIEDDYAYGLAIYGMARVLTLDEDPNNAAEENRLYNLALDLFRNQVPNPVLARQVLQSRGDSFRLINDYEEARSWYRTAANEAREADDPIGEGYALLELGDLRVERLLFDDAIVDYNEATRQFLRGSDWIGRGETLFRLAEIYLLQVNYPSAFESYQEALALYETEGDLLRQAETLTLVGEAYQRQARLALSLNQHFSALARLEDSKEALEQSGEYGSDEITLLHTPIEARIHRNFGTVRIAMGQLEDARESLAIALDFATTAGNTREQAAIQQTIGRVEFLDRNYQLAINRYEESLTLYGDQVSLQTRGELRIDVADACFNLGIATWRGDGVTVTTDDFETSGEVICEPPRGSPAAWLDMVSEARIEYQRALDVARILNDPVLEIRAQQGLGRVFNWLGDNAQAGEYLVAGLDNAEDIEMLPLRASIIVDLGLLAEERGERSNAIEYYRDAVDLFEDVYADIRLEPGQIAFSSHNIMPYHRLVSLYAETDPELALEYAERGRARSLLYQLGTEQIDFGVSGSADLLAEWQSNRQLIRGMYDQIDRNLVEREQAASSSERNRLLEENSNLRRDITEIEDTLEGLQERIDTQSAVLSQVTEVNPRSLTDIQANLTGETSILSYYIIPPSSVSATGNVFAFIINSDSFEITELNVTPTELRTAVNDSLPSMRTLDTINETFTYLYDELIQPVMSGLEGQQVVVVPHGVLNSVPFGALTRDGETFFSDERTLVYASSATLYSLLLDDRDESLVLEAGSAVVFGNPTTFASVPGANSTRDVLADLPEAEEEAEQIAALFDIDAYIGRDATESTLWRQAQESHVIHIAAHGVFNPENPQATFLALSSDEDNDGNLQVREIYSLSLGESQPLVVLSACDTAVGGISESDDVQSLARAFLISGARSVVASLWKVDDAATQALMTRFYENMFGGMTTAEALSDAQAYIRQQPEWSAPRYWAAFVLVGLPT